MIVSYPCIHGGKTLRIKSEGRMIRLAHKIRFIKSRKGFINIVLRRLLK